MSESGNKKYIVDSADKLSDSRAREIAELYNVDFGNILSSYQALEERVVGGGGQIEVDLNISDEEKGQLLAQIAAGAVISYEMTKQEKIYLNSSLALNRIAPTELYETIGDIYRSLLETISAL